MPRLASITSQSLVGLGVSSSSVVTIASVNLSHTLTSSYSNGRFGYSVSVSGDTAIIGAPYTGDTQATSGKAYLYNIATGSLLHTLDNPNAVATTANDQFGDAVAIDGNYAIVGARYEDGKDVPPVQNTFNLTSSQPFAFFNASFPPVAGDNVTLYFDNLDNINTFYEDLLEYGRLEIFINDDTAHLDMSMTLEVFPFGAPVGNYIELQIFNVLNGPSTPDGQGNRVVYETGGISGTDSGMAYIFDVSTGNLTYMLENPNAYGNVTNDGFANKVAISGNYAIVAAGAEDDATSNSSGKAYIFDVTTGALVHTLDNPNPGYAIFGIDVAISGNYAIVGAYGDDADGLNSGRAYIFDVTTGSLVHTLTNPNDVIVQYHTADGFGSGVAISGNYAIVGASGEYNVDGDQPASGVAYIFDVTTGSLVRTFHNPNAFGTSNNEGFGNQVAISGNYAVVGVQAEDDAGGSSSGKAYIFDITTGNLISTLDNPNDTGTSAADRFGGAVAISGNQVVVGAYLEDTGGTQNGVAYSYTIT